MTSEITPRDRWDHFITRLGVGRMLHRVSPGLYALGGPDAESPVFVTANYRLSFDALRSALAGMSAYILVLDTKGINVWCAAGKGTFGTDELVEKIASSRLSEVVTHRKVILPQLGGPGVAAHIVKKRSGFKVEYGPVLASDLPEYMKTGEATPEMRRVRFALKDRFVLIPVEVRYVFWPTLAAALIFYFLMGPMAAGAVVAASLAGTALFPALLPWLPGREFSVKGFALGLAVAAPFAAYALHGEGPGWLSIAHALFYLLGIPPVTAFLALNFTGSSTYTSPTGVRREIFRYIPVMAGSLAVALVAAAAYSVYRFMGGA